MRVLLVAYCFGVGNGQALIGVYKRALRVGHALCDRGHEVSVYCAGRSNYHDAMTRRAEERMAFLDWPWRRPLGEGAVYNRQQTLAAIARAAPDVVVVGEAPLAGPLLETTLAAAELGVPVVCLDNAYGPLAAEEFCRRHGSLYDGIVLSGPSSFHMAHPPPFVLQVPPYIDSSPAAARSFLAGLGVGGKRIVTVLAYDPSVESLGASIIRQLDAAVAAIFVTHRPEACRRRLEALGIADRSSVLEPLDDAAHFGLLQESQFVIGKCAFMQVSECLSLRTPIIGFYFTGDFHLDYIPGACRPFTHMTASADADETTLARARAFLAMSPDAMHAMHDGRLGASTATAAFLEGLPRTPRVETAAECEARGLSRDLLSTALRGVHPGCRLGITDIRMSSLRETGQQVVYTVLCRYTVDDAASARRLWLRHFRDDRGFGAELDAVRASNGGRTLRWHSREHRAFLEEDIGELALPPLHPTGEDA